MANLSDHSEVTARIACIIRLKNHLPQSLFLIATILFTLGIRTTSNSRQLSANGAHP